MNQRWFVGLLGACALLIVPVVASAQPGRGGFGGGGDLMLLGDENVQKELEIVDSQKEKLQALQTRIGEEMRELFRGGGGGGDRDAMREKMREKMEGFQKEVSDVLLPHQRDRLKQISVQSQLRYGNNSNTVGNVLELTDEEKEKLQEEDRKLNAEMQKEVAKIREKYREKLMQTLSPEKQAKWKELVGKPVEFQERQQGGRGGRGGDRGGRTERGGDNSN